VLSVASLLHLLGSRVNVCGRALSPGRGEKAWDLLLSLEAMGLPILRVAVNLLPGAGVFDAGFACDCGLCYAWLEP
jgi:hypothetical protein